MLGNVVRAPGSHVTPEGPESQQAQEEQAASPAALRNGPAEPNPARDPDPDSP